MRVRILVFLFFFFLGATCTCVLLGFLEPGLLLGFCSSGLFGSLARFFLGIDSRLLFLLALFFLEASRCFLLVRLRLRPQVVVFGNENVDALPLLLRCLAFGFLLLAFRFGHRALGGFLLALFLRGLALGLFPLIAAETMQRVATATGAGWVDVRSEFDRLLESRSRDTLFVADGHCNDEGYGVIARTVAGFLIPSHAPPERGRPSDPALR